MIEAIIGLFIGLASGYFIRPFIQKVPVSVTYPPAVGQKGSYTIKFDGRIVYSDNDLQEAKRVFKASYPAGHYVEFFNNGNHVASRETR